MAPDTAFTRFLDDGRICLTNNAAERALRGLALGRKSWLFAGSARGAERAAIMYTLIQTAKLNDVDPQAWPTRASSPVGNSRGPKRVRTSAATEVRRRRLCGTACAPHPALRRAVTHAREENSSGRARKRLSITSVVFGGAGFIPKVIASGTPFECRAFPSSPSRKPLLNGSPSQECRWRHARPVALKASIEFQFFGKRLDMAGQFDNARRAPSLRYVSRSHAVTTEGSREHFAGSPRPGAYPRLHLIIERASIPRRPPKLCAARFARPEAW